MPMRFAVPPVDFPAPADDHRYPVALEGDAYGIGWEFSG